MPSRHPLIELDIRVVVIATGRRLYARFGEEKISLSRRRVWDGPFQLHQDRFFQPPLQHFFQGLVWLWAANKVSASRRLAFFLHTKAYRSLQRSGFPDLEVYARALRRWQQPEPSTRAVIWIRPGPFWMGSPGKTQQRSLPGFWMDRYEVSREAYAFCVLRGSCPPVVHYLEPPLDLPRDRIRPQWAFRYCRFEGKTLPTEEQWVKAARGGLEINGRKNPFPLRRYVWGDAPFTCKHANVRWCYQKKINQILLPVLLPVTYRLLGDSPYGVSHLQGNVAEILQDGSIKGGSGFGILRPISWRGSMDQREGLSWVGFRCVRNAL